MSTIDTIANELKLREKVYAENISRAGATPVIDNAGRLNKLSIITLSLILLTGCGGGGGSNASNTSEPVNEEDTVVEEEPDLIQSVANYSADYFMQTRGSFDVYADKIVHTDPFYAPIWDTLGGDTRWVVFGVVGLAKPNSGFSGNETIIINSLILENRPAVIETITHEVCHIKQHRDGYTQDIINAINSQPYHARWHEQECMCQGKIVAEMYMTAYNIPYFQSNDTAVWCNLSANNPRPATPTIKASARGVYNVMDIIAVEK